MHEKFLQCQLAVFFDVLFAGHKLSKGKFGAAVAICLAALTLACGSGAGTGVNASSQTPSVQTGTSTPSASDGSGVTNTTSAPLNPVATAPNSGTTTSNPNAVSVPSSSSAPVVTPASATTFSHMEDMSGWTGCTACTGGGDKATYSMHQKQSSPSVDGSSARFSIGGEKPFSNALWWRTMSSDGTASHFVLDMYYYIDQPEHSQALEFAVNQSVGNEWYKFSTQCAFADNEWSVWDSKHEDWVGTGIGCTRPPADSWRHVVFEYQRSNGMAVFVSITVNGETHDVNMKFSPQPLRSAASVGIHFQLDGDSSQQSYNVWADCVTLTYW